MLRNFVIGFGLVALLCGLAALATGLFPPAAIFGFWGAGYGNSCTRSFDICQCKHL